MRGRTHRSVALVERPAAFARSAPPAPTVLTTLIVLTALIGCTAPATSPTRRPNILLIVADDMGYTDLGAYGSEIATPVLDRLAAGGLKFSRFRTSPVCSPTRASLLSGTDPHVAGLGNMFEDLAPNQKGQPGYEGFLNFSVAALPEVLQAAGYHTYMAGKWHLGLEEQTGPAARGFERSYALLQGGGGHFANMQPILGDGRSKYRDNGALVAQVPADFYSTRFFADTLMRYIGERSPQDEAPFFAYLAFTAPHFPLQAPDDSIARYKGRYDGGYDRLFVDRLDAAKRLGLVPASARGGDPYPGQPRWDALTLPQQATEARRMEIFAAMVTDVDTHVGRVLDFLRARGDLDHTIVVFMSDNGAEGHHMETEWVELAEHAARCCDNSLANMGRPGSYVWLGPNWARASTAPFKWFKGHFSEGGVRAPLIVSYPALKTTGLTDAVASVADVMPTVLDLVGVPRPGAQFAGRAVAPITGVSLRPLLEGRAPSAHAPDNETAGELFGKRFVAEGSLKALLLPKPHGTGQWQLYDLDADPSETTDLARVRPVDLARLRGRWDRYAARNRVIVPDWVSGY